MRRQAGLPRSCGLQAHDQSGSPCLPAHHPLFLRLPTDLVHAHAASGRAAFLPVGTPTNNLPGQPAGWTSAADPFAGYEQLVAAPLPAVRSATSRPPRRRGALGLDRGALDGLSGADDAHLEGATLDDAHLERTILDGANLEGAVATLSTSWPRDFDWKDAKVRMR